MKSPTKAVSADRTRLHDLIMDALNLRPNNWSRIILEGVIDYCEGDDTMLMNLSMGEKDGKYHDSSTL